MFVNDDTVMPGGPFLDKLIRLCLGTDRPEQHEIPLVRRKGGIKRTGFDLSPHKACFYSETVPMNRVSSSYIHVKRRGVS